MMTPAVSVIIPTYNCEKYIAEAIHSVLVQTFSDFEIIVVDDGSTDNTRAVIENIKDFRIKYIYQQNASQAIARNNGIALASGKFIAFLDSDDIWLPGKLELQLRQLEDASAALSYTGTFLIDKDSVKIGSGVAVQVKQSLFPVISILQSNCIACSSVMLRRESLISESLVFRSGRQAAEDWDMWLRLAVRIKILSIPEELTGYRVFEGNISKRADLLFSGQMQTLNDFEEEIRSGVLGRKKDILSGICKARFLYTRRYAHWLLANNRQDEAQSIMRRLLFAAPIDIHNWWGLIKSHLPR